MLELTQFIKLDEAAIKSRNLCDRFLEDDLKRIGTWCHDGYTRDEASRYTWLKRNEAGMDLALQIQKNKTFPWPGCSNVAFPLVAIAAQQFHAQAYPALFDGPNIVKCAVPGIDPTGALSERGDRIGMHMSWQLLYQDREWEPQEDKALLNLSIVGTNFKKSYWSGSKAHNISELVLAKDLVLDYWSKSVENSPRVTHVIPFFRNEVWENVKRELWRDVLEEAWYQAPPVVSNRSMAQVNKDNRQGVQVPPADETSAFTFLEQHCNLDLDGDGYAEPYIITLEKESKTVVRIVTRFDSDKDIERVVRGANKGQIIQIRATEYFTCKTFIPSPDGGIYGIGFGVFLGPLNEAVNSLVNMLLDCGTLQTTGGGFLARGAKIRGGAYTFAPFEWKRVDSTGDDLRKSVFPLPINQPSDVLFQLLSLLINYTNRLAGSTDTMIGENPGQNTPAETMRTMTELGRKVYNAIYKRVWRSWKDEFAKLYILNRKFLPLDQPQPGGATREDYLPPPNDVVPVADPSITSDTQRMQQAVALKQAAATTPGYDADAVERRYLRALKVDAPDQVFKGTQGQPPKPSEKLQIAQMKEQGATERLQQQLQFDMQASIMQLMEERQLNNAKIAELMAKAEEAAANAQSEMAYAQVASIQAEISAAQHDNDRTKEQIDTMIRLQELRTKQLFDREKLLLEYKKLAKENKKAA